MALVESLPHGLEGPERLLEVVARGVGEALEVHVAPLERLGLLQEDLGLGVALARVPNRPLQGVGVELALDQEVLGACLEAGLDQVLLHLPCEDNDWGQAGLGLVEALEELRPVPVGQVQVEEDAVEVPAL